MTYSRLRTSSGKKSRMPRAGCGLVEGTQQLTEWKFAERGNDNLNSVSQKAGRKLRVVAEVWTAAMF